MLFDLNTNTVVFSNYDQCSTIGIELENLKFMKCLMRGLGIKYYTLPIPIFSILENNTQQKNIP